MWSTCLANSGRGSLALHKPGACNLRPQEVEPGGLAIQGHLELV